MDRLGIPYKTCHKVGTIIHLAIDGEYAGHIVISDVEKPTSKEAIAKLKQAGIQKTIMLTGDAKQVADQVAADLGIDEVYSELLPGDKVEQVERLRLRSRRRQIGICRRRYQRCTGSWKSGYRYCDGGNGIRCGN